MKRFFYAIAALVIFVPVHVHCSDDQSAAQEQTEQMSSDGLDSSENIAQQEASVVQPDSTQQTESASENQQEAPAPETQVPASEPIPQQEDKPKEEPKSVDGAQSLSQPSTAQPAVQEEQLSIDTVNQQDPQGNWLFKRIWWDYAETRYEKLRLLVQDVQEQRLIFLAKRNQIERAVLDPFYLSVGMGQGEMQELIASLLHTIEKAVSTKHAEGQVTKELEERAQKEKSELEQLNRDVTGINLLEDRLDKATETLLEVVNRVVRSEQESWQHFKEISRVLNDKKARDLFYQIKSASDNIAADLEYIKGPLSLSFDELAQKITEQVDRIKSRLSALKEEGIQLKASAEQLDHHEKATEPEEEQKEEPKKSWLSTLARPFVWIGNSIVSLIRAPYDIFVYFFGSQPQETEESE